MDEQIERELKFDVPEGWTLPDPAPVTPRGGSVRSQTIRMSSTYFDTLEHDLLRSGITLRRRTGDTDTGWHLKVPAGDARTEIRLPVGGESVPAEMLQLVRGIAGGATVRPIATLATQRNVHKLVGSEGNDLAEIADDEVTATVGGSALVITKWHEVEVELAGGDEKLLRRSAHWLARSGATPASVGSKLARAMGEDADRPQPGTLGALLYDYLHEQHRVMVRGDIELRRNADVVHRTRVATRRFRSVLRVFGSLFDEARAVALDAELAWYAERLGALRDVQVMRDHLRAQVAALPADVRSDGLGVHIGEALRVDEQEARGELLAALSGDRYTALLREVRRFVEDEPTRVTMPKRDVEKFVRSALRTERRRLRSAGHEPVQDDRMHRARKAAKRARYTAEVARPVLGKTARREVKRGKQLQDELGELQDAIVASHYLLGLANADGEIAFGLGVLWSIEQKRAAQARRTGRKRARSA
ncbi:MAG TPA: CYTH and CHAD domain-containing protein [Jatrophihabitantaceae bacterium]|nr:CYTH and CHAD domain-containing protein [Jatrophihabitantaceae bacterium]